MSSSLRLRFDKLEYGVGEPLEIIAEISPSKDECVYVDVISDVSKLTHYRLDRVKEGYDIFMGTIHLIGTHKKPTGLGPLDGALPVKRGGEVRAVLQHEGQMIEFEAIIVEILPEIIFDKEEYTPFDWLIVSVISPDSNEDPDQIENISVLLSSSTASLGIVKFPETGPNTGIFEDEFYLTPDPKKYRGDLQVIRGDGITLEFRIDEDTVATKSVFVNYHVGQIMFEKDVYAIDDKAIIRVIDPDENRNPDAIDIIKVRVWSSTDKNGLEIVLTETGDRTGIFEGIVRFTKLEQSRGNLLRVSDGDIITTTYIDKTLPEPARLSENLIETIEHAELFATASIGEAKPLPKIEVAPTKGVGPIAAYVIVEGSVDETFFNSVLAKVYETSFETLRFDPFQQSKSAQCPFIRSSVTKGKDIIAFRDVDNKTTLKDVLENCKNQINTLPSLKCEVINDEIKVSNGVLIKIIELGLPDDEDLRMVGITQGAVEDYLLKLLVIDTNVQKWAGVSLRELREHLEPFKSLKGVELNKSKAFISMLASLKRLSYEDTVAEITKVADRNNVEVLTKDILKHLIDNG